MSTPVGGRAAGRPPLSPHHPTAEQRWALQGHFWLWLRPQSVVADLINRVWIKRTPAPHGAGHRPHAHRSLHCIQCLGARVQLRLVGNRTPWQLGGATPWPPRSGAAGSTTWVSESYWGEPWIRTPIPTFVQLLAPSLRVMVGELTQQSRAAEGWGGGGGAAGFSYSPSSPQGSRDSVLAVPFAMSRGTSQAAMCVCLWVGLGGSLPTAAGPSPGSRLTSAFPSLQTGSHFPRRGWGSYDRRGGVASHRHCFPRSGKGGFPEDRFRPHTTQRASPRSCTSSFQLILNHPEVQLGRKEAKSPERGAAAGPGGSTPHPAWTPFLLCGRCLFSTEGQPLLGVGVCLPQTWLVLFRGPLSLSSPGCCSPPP